MEWYCTICICAGSAFGAGVTHCLQPERHVGLLKVQLEHLKVYTHSAASPQVACSSLVCVVPQFVLALIFAWCWRSTCTAVVLWHPANLSTPWSCSILHGQVLACMGLLMLGQLL